MMQAIDNRMVIGEYYEDEADRDYIIATAEIWDYEMYVFMHDACNDALRAYYGPLDAVQASHIWDDLREERRAEVCKAWVEKKRLDDFVEWMKERCYGAV